MAFVVALVIGILATPLATAIARRFGVVDRPGPLKLQTRPVAYLGGIAVGLSWAVGTVTGAGASRLLVPVALALVLGLADDVLGVSPKSRLALELAIGVTGGWAVPAMPGPVGWLVTATFVVGLLNAVNLLDGLDALASGVCAASALGFAAVDGGHSDVALALAGGLVAFLAYNRPPALIYLGDAGSYLVGTVLALLAAAVLRSDDGAARWAALPLLVLVPVVDTAVAIVRRGLARAPLLQGDRSHVYDQLVDRGYSVATVSGGLAAAQAVVAAIAVGVSMLDPRPALAAAGVTTGGVLALVVVGGFLRPETTATPPHGPG